MLFSCLIGFWWLLAISASAQWPTSPDQRLALGNGTATQIVANAEGGAYIAFTASSGAMQSRCYLQLLDRNGYSVLPAPLYLDSGSGIYVDDFQAVTDGMGGAIIGVLERCGSDPDWYWRLAAYRFNADGEILYQTTVNASGEVVPQDYFVMAADSSGGCYLSYMDVADYRVQRLSSAGLRLWGDNGLPLDVGSAYPQQYDLTIGADASHCYLTVRGNDLRAFKFTPDGNFVWGESGLAITDLGEDTQLAPDGTGGLVEICTSDQGHLMAYRLDADGNWVWPLTGVDLGSCYWDKSVLCRFPYVYLCWLSDDSPRQARVQKLDYLGNLQWPESFKLFSGTAIQDDPAMSITDDQGLVFICRQMNGFVSDLYAQKVSYQGEWLWDSGGVQLTTRGYTAFSLNIASDKAGGALCNWYEIDPTMGQLICAAMVNCEGVLGQVLGVKTAPTTNLPQTLNLAVYPNPANAAFTISYEINIRQAVSLAIYNHLGQLVWQNSLGIKPPGSYRLTWQNEQLASGAYLVQLVTAERGETQPVVILK